MESTAIVYHEMCGVSAFIYHRSALAVTASFFPSVK